MKSKDYQIKISTLPNDNTFVEVRPVIKPIMKIRRDIDQFKLESCVIPTGVYQKIIEENSELVKIQTLIDYYNKLKDMFGIDMYPSDHLKYEIKRLKEERELCNGY